MRARNRALEERGLQGDGYVGCDGGVGIGWSACFNLIWRR